MLYCSVPQCHSATFEVNREDKTNHLGGTTLSSGQRTQIQTQMHNCYENDLVKGSEAKYIRLLEICNLLLHVFERVSQEEDPLSFKTCGSSLKQFNIPLR